MNIYYLKIKSIGFSFYVPLLVVLIIIFIIFSGFYREEDLQKLLVLIQVSMGSIAAWWFSNIYRDIFFREQNDFLLVNYRYAHKKFYSFFMIIYAALLLIICITLWFQYSLPFLPFFSFLLFQCCFFSSLGLFITMLLKNTDISVLAVSLYCLIDFITIGTFPNWHHVILFNFTEKVSFIETVSPNLINLIATFLFSKLVMTIWK